MTHSYFISHKAISNCMLYVCVMKSSANCHYKISAKNWRGRKTTERNHVITHKGADQNYVRFLCSLAQDIFSDRAKHFPVLSSNLQAVRQLGFCFYPRIAECTLAAKYNRDRVWLCLYSHLCSVSLMPKPRQPCVTAVSCQTGRPCPLHGVPVVTALSGKFHAFLKGHTVRENTFWLEKTQLMHSPGNFSHFWVGQSQKHMDFQFYSAPSTICLRDLL